MRPGGHPGLVVHGGAWDIPADEHDAHVGGVARARNLGAEMLQAGAPALEVVVACTRLLEDDPTFDAGTGSHLTSDGLCEMDALLMDGAALRSASVAALQRVKNPIDAALVLLRRSPHAMLVGPGAERFYAAHGGRLVEPPSFIVPRELARFQEGRAAAATGGSTVGAVARDVAGHVAVAVSTGGTLAKHPGRVGDSPLPGCGGFADDVAGAVGSTGHGEAIMRVVLAKGVTDRLAAGHSAQAAADDGIANLARRTGSRAGCIVISARGDVGWAHNTPHMAVGAWWHGPDGEWRTHVGLG